MSDFDVKHHPSEIRYVSADKRLDLTFDVEGQIETVTADGQFRVIVQFPYRKERRSRDARRSIYPVG